MKSYLSLLLVCTLPACAEFPALDGTISDAARAAPYPAFEPLPTTPARTAPPPRNNFDARIAALKTRGERLRRYDFPALR